MNYSEITLLSDIDGILTNGEHIYSALGKDYKCFGSNDKDAIRELQKIFKTVLFCTADKSAITDMRIKDMGLPPVQFCSVTERQNLVDSLGPCIYLGDGIFEPHATLNMCLLDSTPQARSKADVILQTQAGKNVFAHLLDWLKEQNIISFAQLIKENFTHKLILSGVGKNFLLAQLVNDFCHPYNLETIALDANHSLHGSLGIIKEEDVVIISSKSGNTEELLAMSSALKYKFPNFKKLFLITSNPNAKLQEFTDYILHIESDDENSLHNLSPQTTICKYLHVYLSILNIINQNSQTTRRDYLLNHRGGSIGELSL